MAEESRKQVNIDFTNFDDLLKDLDQMADDDGMNRSQLVRKLVRQEKARRQPLPQPDSQPKKRSGESREPVAA